MQTFLPYRNFSVSAACLDRKRLGKQRVECLQLLKAIRNGGGWANHPAAKMWAPYTQSLVLYGMAMCAEWMERGYQDTCLEKIKSFWDPDAVVTMPHWLGDEDFHASHRSNLLRKDPGWYGQFGWLEKSDLPYVWPLAFSRG